MRVLALCSYPIEAASTRFRLAQFVEPLRQRGVGLEISPFLSSSQFAALYRPGNTVGKAAGMALSVLKRVGQAPASRKYDVILVQREAALFGPAFFETLYRLIGKTPMVLDLDDATYVSYRSPSYGRVGSYLKFFGKTDRLIERAATVICGNRFIKEHVESKGTRGVVIPTVVDTDVFCPAGSVNDVPVVGWIGTHSTYPFLEWLFPVLGSLGEKHRFVLKVVGAGRDVPPIEGVDLQSLPWDLKREVNDFRSIDIGLYPMTLSDSANSAWLQGKSGFKAIQYLAVGVPFVMSPVGVAAEIGVPGTTHFNATNIHDWYTYLHELLADPILRRDMGIAGRHHSLENYSVDKQANLLAEALKGAGAQH